MPSRVQLHTKRSVRCRRCVRQGRPGILLKPHLAVLAGDASAPSQVCLSAVYSNCVSLFSLISQTLFSRCRQGSGSRSCLPRCILCHAWRWRLCMLVLLKTAGAAPWFFGCPTPWMRIASFDSQRQTVAVIFLVARSGCRQRSCGWGPGTPTIWRGCSQTPVLLCSVLCCCSARLIFLLHRSFSFVSYIEPLHCVSFSILLFVLNCPQWCISPTRNVYASNLTSR